ncbi:hypothetical protein RISK_002979 [Rhodopirellula islandica]|uniref:Uncharacterized protein n=1 Tax=Rhodopirellula islandica TaxID=595434 RepID=A0A0J1BEP8_RHOIS|nr:hypothetical protein RISK_002979 [Rhodopirellula islandica]
MNFLRDEPLDSFAGCKLGWFVISKGAPSDAVDQSVISQAELAGFD